MTRVFKVMRYEKVFRVMRYDDGSGDDRRKQKAFPLMSLSDFSSVITILFLNQI